MGEETEKPKSPKQSKLESMWKIKQVPNTEEEKQEETSTEEGKTQSKEENSK